MRECPDYIAKALREYDPELRMVWNQRKKQWVFWRGDMVLFQYRHIDGTTAVNDLSVDEIMFIIRRSDAHANYDLRRREMRQIGELRESRESREKQRRESDNERETDSIVDFFGRGKKPKPFVPPLSIGASKPLKV